MESTAARELQNVRKSCQVALVASYMLSVAAVILDGHKDMSHNIIQKFLNRWKPRWLRNV